MHRRAEAEVGVLGDVERVPSAERRSTSVRKWLLVPPSGIGRRSLSRPGSRESNQNKYSSVNIRVRKSSVQL